MPHRMQTGNPLGDHDIGLFSIIYGLLGHDVLAYLQSNFFENTRVDLEFWTWLAMAHALGTTYEKKIMEKSNK
ncbi:protein phosphatase 2C 62 [Pyrus ussuriensis x Pyrus communis]|uniref:Protein phosphatase 2C 62 n=1 Tax=Pyrus ussuriensis x Pyrus communis TaxID=2448454 RepID=A0A5N5IGL2_9ROSA|nr:protein phosphatase 2C 62 [Pyrus ussuriensis x Pyrus communis]